MSHSRPDTDAETLARYEAALDVAGYEVYERDGAWYYNGKEFGLDEDFADGPYGTKDQALEVAVRNLGLINEDEGPETPAPR